MTATKAPGVLQFWSAFGALLVALVTGLMVNESRASVANTERNTLIVKSEELEKRVRILERYQDVEITKLANAIESAVKSQNEVKSSIDKLNQHLDIFFDLNPQLRRPGRPDVITENDGN